MRKFAYSFLLASQLLFSTIFAEQNYRTLFLERDKQTVVEASDTNDDGYLDYFELRQMHSFNSSSVKMPNSYVKKLVEKFKKKDRSTELRNAREMYSQPIVEGYLKTQYFPEAGVYYKFSLDARLRDYNVLDHIRDISRNGGFTDADLIVVKTQLEFEKNRKIIDKR